MMQLTIAAPITLLLIAALAIPIRATAQNGINSQPSLNCPIPAAIEPIHLYGLWQAEFSNQQSAWVRLGRHPEWPGSVRGELDRAGVKTLVAGDVDQGQFVLEESSDGQLIAATWLGQVAAHSCGKEIQGIWTDTTHNISATFVLRKQPGWQ